MFVESVMSRPVATMEARQHVWEAARLMRARRFRHLPVVENGRLAGIVSDRELEGDGDRRLDEVMHRDVITVTERVPVEEAAALMLENKIGCLPVLDDRGGLAGIVAESDLFRLLTRLFGGEGPSTRIQMQLEDLPRQMAIVTALALEHRAALITLLTAPPGGPPGSPRTVVARIQTMNPGPFVAALRAAGLEVDAPTRGAPGAPEGS